MLTLEQLRKIDPRLERIDDEKLKELRAAMYQLGQLCFDVWWNDKSGSKNPVGLFTPKETNDTLKP